MTQFLFDYHIHNRFSSDGKGSVNEFCKIAAEKKFTHIAFTNHAEKFSETEQQYFINYETFSELYHLEKKEIEDAKEAYPHIDISLGVEVENRWKFFDEINAILTNLSFDVILGSVHVLDGVSVSSSKTGPVYMANHTAEHVYDTYFKELLVLLEKIDFDVLAHMDIFKRYATAVFGAFPVEKYQEKLASYFSLLAKKGIALEINTSGYRQDPKEAYPGKAILEIAYTAGVDITVGSDAHSPAMLGADILTAIQMAKDVGYTQMAVFKNRKKKMLAL